jgi:CBS domain containing-hemolysin-like protein
LTGRVLLACFVRWLDLFVGFEIMTLTALGLLYGSLLLLLAVVSAVETAIHSVREVDGAGGGSPADEANETGLDRRLRKIRQNPFDQLQQTLLLSAALNLALALLGLYAVTGPLRSIGWNPWVVSPILFGLTVLVGDAVPKLFAARRAPELLVLGNRLLLPVRLVVDPLARWAERIAEGVLRRLVPEGMKARSGMTREEFETLVEMREEQRVVTAHETAMIREILDLESLNVRDAMVPRVDVPLAFSGRDEAGVRAALEVATGRFVVVHGDTPDLVEGVVDTLAWRLEGRPPYREMLRPPVFVPETFPLLDALERHLGQSSSAVLVVDEYGGLEGLVSQEEIADWLLHEAAPWLGEEVEIRELEPGRWLLDGGARLDHIEEVTGSSLTPEGAEGIDTVGGLVFKLLGHVPKPGERVMAGEATLKVRRMARARVKQLEMRLPERKVEEKEVEP